MILFFGLMSLFIIWILVRVQINNEQIAQLKRIADALERDRSNR